MLRLLDGPCEGTYMVKRAPAFLRAVIDAKGEKDVLDQLEDTPAKNEKVFVYQLQGDAGWVHLKMGKRSLSGFYAHGNYKYLPDIDGEKLRDNAAWRAWATEQFNITEAQYDRTDKTKD